MFHPKHLTLSVYTLVNLIPCFAVAEELPSVPATVLIKSGTAVKLQFSNTISSASAHQGDKVDFVVEKGVAVDGYTVVRAGELARGSVV